MATTFMPTGLDTSEWFDTVTPGFFSTLDMPEPTEKFCYAAMRLLSWFPVINQRGATYFESDISDSLVGTLVTKLANLRHEKGMIVGTIIKAAKNSQGIDIIVQIDKEAASEQGMSLDDMAQNMVFSQVSVECERDLTKCRFLVVDGGYNVLREIPVLMGISAGIHRTADDPENPYYFQGHRVVEALVPEYFSGVGFVPIPADPTAKLYAVAASADGKDGSMENADPKKPYGDTHYADPGYRNGMSRYPVGDKEHTIAAAHYFGVEANRAKYSSSEAAHIDGEIRAAKKKFGVGQEDASADTHADPGFDGGPKRHPLDSEENVMQAKNHFDSLRNRSKYSGPQLKAIDKNVDTAMKRLGKTDEEACEYASGCVQPEMTRPEYANAPTPEATASDHKELASNMDELEKLKSENARLTAELASAVEAKETASAAEATKVSELEAQVATLTTELASATAERDELKAKEIAAAREAKVNALCKELASILPTENDEEAAGLKETASAIVDNDDKVAFAKLERTNAAQAKELAALKAEKAAAPTEDPKEVASGKPTFDPGVTPEIETLPQVAANGKPSDDILNLC